jgi:hypothetical protein
MTYAQRHPTVNAIAGTASPASRVAIGIAACLIPKESPSRVAGTCRVSVRFDESWPSTLHHAQHSSMTTSAGNDRANAAIADIEHTVPSTAARLVGPAPYRSTSHPQGSDATALIPKYRATTRPRPAGSKPSSAESCTVSAPVRNTGSTVAVVVVTAPIAARTGRAM